MKEVKQWTQDLTDLPAGTKVLIYDTPLDFGTAQTLVSEIELIDRGFTRTQSDGNIEEPSQAERRKQRFLRCFKPRLATIDKFVDDAFCWRGYWINFDHNGRDIRYPGITSLREDLENLHDPDKHGGEGLIMDLEYYLLRSPQARSQIENGGSLFQSAVQTTHDWIDKYSEPPWEVVKSTRFQDVWNILAYFDEDAQKWAFRPSSIYDIFPGGAFDTKALDAIGVPVEDRPKKSIVAASHKAQVAKRTLDELGVSQ
tara:strand:+ start:879 stop:1646 length:768 start_codon:yes stop_codon:yes gene_type:complete